MSVNFIGAPSLPLSGFKDYKQNFVLGASLQVFLPLVSTIRSGWSIWEQTGIPSS